MNNRSYFLFNCIWAGIIILLLFYAGFFAYSEHAMHCVYKESTGMDCPTCGLTRSFHHILIGNIDEAMKLNIMSIRLFSFFAIQLVLRLFLFFFFLKKKKYSKYFIPSDIIFSIVLFLVCFYPLLIDFFI